MTTGLTFTNGQVVTGDGRIADRLHIDGSRIVAAPAGASGATIDLEGGWLLPGFIDTQVNGGGGVLFNDDPSVETIRRIGAAHARFGCLLSVPFRGEGERGATASPSPLSAVSRTSTAATSAS